MADDNPEGWTFATLYMHFNERFLAAKEAILKVEQATEKRFESVNEFRNTLRDQQSGFASKDQMEFRLAAIEKRLTDIQGIQSTQGGKAQGMSMVAIIITQSILILIALGGLAIAFSKGTPG
jgi:anion-transporting  ArsA/GET3 family ATPase